MDLDLEIWVLETELLRQRVSNRPPVHTPGRSAPRAQYTVRSTLRVDWFLAGAPPCLPPGARPPALLGTGAASESAHVKQRSCVPVVLRASAPAPVAQTMENAHTGGGHAHIPEYYAGAGGYDLHLANRADFCASD